MVRMAVGSPLPSLPPSPPALVVTGRQGHFELMNGLYGLAATRASPKADPSSVHGSRQFVQVFYTKEGPSECGKRDGSDLVLVCQYEQVSSAPRSPPGLGPDKEEEKPWENGEHDECSSYYKEWTGCAIGWRQQPNGKPIDQNLKKTFWSERPWWQEFFVCARGGLLRDDGKDTTSLAGRLFEARLGWEVRDEEGEFQRDGCNLRLACPGDDGRAAPVAAAGRNSNGRVTLRLAEDASLTSSGGAAAAGGTTTPKPSGGEQFNIDSQNPFFNPAMIQAMMAAGMMSPGGDHGGINPPMNTPMNTPMAGFPPPGGYPGMPSEMMGPHGMMPFPPFDPATFGMPPLAEDGRPMAITPSSKNAKTKATRVIAAKKGNRGRGSSDSGAAANSSSSSDQTSQQQPHTLDSTLWLGGKQHSSSEALRSPPAMPSAPLASSSGGLVEAPNPPKWEPYLSGVAGRSAGFGDKGSLSADAPCFVPMANVDENKEMR